MSMLVGKVHDGQANGGREQRRRVCRGRWDPTCTNAHAKPPELAEHTSATTNRAPDAEIAAPRQPGAGDWLPTSNTNPDVSEPVKIISVSDRHPADPYIEDLLRKKGLDERQIACIISIMRQYTGSFLRQGHQA